MDIEYNGEILTFNLSDGNMLDIFSGFRLPITKKEWFEVREIVLEDSFKIKLDKFRKGKFKESKKINVSEFIELYERYNISN